MGDEANLEMLPAPVWTVGQDPGAYHTSPFVISRDPETRVRNVGTYRVQVKGPRKGGMMINPRAGMRQHIQKNESLGCATEAAIVFGTDPTIGLTSVSPFPVGVDELAAAGGIRGEAVKVVKCLTVDLEVPATAEIVVEGRVLCQVREPEGPFGEYAGYMGAGGTIPFSKSLASLTGATRSTRLFSARCLPASLVASKVLGASWRSAATSSGISGFRCKMCASPKAAAQQPR